MPGAPAGASTTTPPRPTSPRSAGPRSSWERPIRSSLRRSGTTEGPTPETPPAEGDSARCSRARSLYQTGAVKLNHRAVPDVSMLAEEEPGIAIFCSETACQGPNSSWAPMGTSAAAPMLAGGLALVDERLHAAGREQLGLVNPLIYALGKSSARTSAFDDVTTGNNDPFYAGDPFGAPLGCCNATVGYDEGDGMGDRQRRPVCSLCARGRAAGGARRGVAAGPPAGPLERRDQSDRQLLGGVRARSLGACDGRWIGCIHRAVAAGFAASRGAQDRRAPTGAARSRGSSRPNGRGGE